MMLCWLGEVKMDQRFAGVMYIEQKRPFFTHRL